MSKQTINIGASPNDGTGTPLRTSFDYTNQNFTELYTALGGGVGLPGATTQVIFNDGGTNLAGDAGLVYNKTTDALTVAGLVTAGSATITGDLSAAGNSTLGTSAKSTDTNLNFSADTGTQRIYLDRGGRNLIFKDVTSNIENYRITGVTGVQTWGVGGTTAMTLNSTGLAIGGTALGKFTAYSTTNGDTLAVFRCTGTGTQRGLYLSADNSTGVVSIDISGSSAGSLQFKSGGTNTMLIDTSGNVGIGVTPSGWVSGAKALQISSFFHIAQQTNGAANVGFACYESPANAFSYRSTGDAPTLYSQLTGAHRWFTAAAGTAGNAITFTQAMTLDASGNLKLGTTGGTLPSRLYLSGDATNNWSVGPYTSAATNFYITANNTSGVFLNGTGATAWSAISDERYKDIIEPISNAVSKVASLRAVIGKFKLDPEGTRRSFLIAQDLLAAFPEVVIADNPDKLAVTYTEIIPLLVAAIKELTARVQTLEAK